MFYTIDCIDYTFYDLIQRDAPYKVTLDSQDATTHSFEITAVGGLYHLVMKVFVLKKTWL